MYTLFDLVALIIIGALGFIGLRRGLIEEALKFVGIILASSLAVRFYGLGVALIADIFNVSEGIRTVIGFVIVFLIVYLSVQLLSSILKRIVSSLNLVWLDRLSGLAFGAVKGVLIMSIVVWCFSIFSGTQIVNKLEAGSPAYILLSHCETNLIGMFKLEQRSDSLKESIRGIFRMDAPLPSVIPALPDSLGRKLEYIDKLQSRQVNP
ncbi:MAG: CvpA family protein [Candidatus Marinimicrobia bacterium]|nr:CvpA family protein [Candidatus Neomarinimicrobiota bacterium]